MEEKNTLIKEFSTAFVGILANNSLSQSASEYRKKQWDFQAIDESNMQKSVDVPMGNPSKLFGELFTVGYFIRETELTFSKAFEYEKKLIDHNEEISDILSSSLTTEEKILKIAKLKERQKVNIGIGDEVKDYSVFGFSNSQECFNFIVLFYLNRLAKNRISNIEPESLNGFQELAGRSAAQGYCFSIAEEIVNGTIIGKPDECYLCGKKTNDLLPIRTGRYKYGGIIYLLCHDCNVVSVYDYLIGLFTYGQEKEVKNWFDKNFKQTIAQMRLKEVITTGYNYITERYKSLEEDNKAELTLDFKVSLLEEAQEIEELIYDKETLQELRKSFELLGTLYSELGEKKEKAAILQGYIHAYKDEEDEPKLKKVKETISEVLNKNNITLKEFMTVLFSSNDSSESSPNIE